jgi:hypothetical protein
MARETTRGDPVAVNVTVAPALKSPMCACGPRATLAQWSNQLEREV